MYTIVNHNLLFLNNEVSIYFKIINKYNVYEFNSSLNNALNISLNVSLNVYLNVYLNISFMMRYYIFKQSINTLIVI
jgi:hypothetical protein